MLILTRQSGQGCVVMDAEGNVILEVVVAEVVNGCKVKLGFKGDRDAFIVDREEVWQSKMLRKKASPVD